MTRIFMLDLVPVKMVDSHVHLDDPAFDADREAVLQRAREAGVVALITVGTTLESSRAAVALADCYVQAEAFRRHRNISIETGLPLIIHCREAFPAVLDILQEWDVSGVVMHAFSGTPDVAQACVDRGYMISLAGPVTFRNARTAVEVARIVPMTSLLVETDAPVLAPVPFRGRRNEPAFLPYTVRRIAEVKGVTDAELARATADNARHVFRIGAA